MQKNENFQITGTREWSSKDHSERNGFHHPRPFSLLFQPPCHGYHQDALHTHIPQMPAS
jgi:hypothetical protein